MDAPDVTPELEGTDPLLAFVMGTLSFEAAARAMSDRPETQPTMLEVHPGGSATPEQDARIQQLEALMTRVDEINRAERLVLRQATAPRIDDWDDPPDATDFCLSLEVVLSGRDQLRSHRASYRLYVCTPTWLARQVRELGPVWVPAPLVMSRWHPQAVHRALEKLVTVAPEEKWPQFVTRMSRVLEPEG